MIRSSSNLNRLGLRRLYSTESLLRTPLYDFHIRHEAKMVPYAGFEMPVLYKTQTHIESHNWVRQEAGMFDVSHMLQHRVSGPGSTELLEKITPADLKGLMPFSSTLSVLLNSNGGIVDDTIITKHAEDEYYIVTNAGCRDKDLKFINDAIDQFGAGNVKRETINGGLIALQGPNAAQVLQKMTTFDLSTIKFGQSAFVDLVDGHYHVARGGYTGEDGFEISIPDDSVSMRFADQLIDAGKGLVKPIGLAARDSLRLEAGMCLYGHELSEDITPVEAGLTWVIGKRRRAEGGGFNGSEAILKQIAQKSGLRRIGMMSQGPAARDGTKILDNADGKLIGHITSGSLSPTLKKNISMGYVPKQFAKAGTKLSLNIRGKFRDAEVVKLPFVQPKYFN